MSKSLFTVSGLLIIIFIVYLFPDVTTLVEPSMPVAGPVPSVFLRAASGKTNRVRCTERQGKCPGLTPSCAFPRWRVDRSPRAHVGGGSDWYQSAATGDDDQPPR